MLSLDKKKPCKGSETKTVQHVVIYLSGDFPLISASNLPTIPKLCPLAALIVTPAGRHFVAQNPALLKSLRPHKLVIAPVSAMAMTGTRWVVPTKPT